MKNDDAQIGMKNEKIYCDFDAVFIRTTRDRFCLVSLAYSIQI